MLIVRSHRPRRARGFSLIELAFGLVIVAILLSSLLVPLVTQIDQRRVAETQRLLDEARSALIGFAAANSRLPCPAIATSNGQEAFAAGGNPNNGSCANFVAFVPAATLGLSPVDALGFQTDPYGNDSNRIRYAVADTTTNGVTYPYTTMSTATTGMRGATMAAIAASSSLLHVCSAASTTANSCTAGVSLANGTAIAVIYSIGKNALTTGVPGVVLGDEGENVTKFDQVFVSRPPSAATATVSEFDDMLVWISPSMLFGRLIAAGQQP